MYSSGLLRVPRSLGITAAIFSIAAGAHVLSGGVLPPPGILAALGAVSVVPVAALSGRRFSFLMLIALMGAGQISLHGAFTALSLPGRCLPSVSAGLPHHEPVSCAGSAQALPGYVVEHPAGFIFIAHLAAVLLTALVLAKGDEALFGIRQWLAPLLNILRPVALLPTGAPRLVARRTPVIIRPARRMYHFELRGPPSSMNPATA
ncbi:hypothetical protein [Arthrobacter sp. TMN-50]